MNPFDNEEAYRYIVFGGKRSPGTVTLSGHDRNRDWDIKAAKGQVGASSTLVGAPIGEFEATFYLVRDFLNDIDEYAEWETFQRELDAATSGPTAKAYPIYHPDLALQGFTEVSVSSVGGLVHDGKGGAIVKVKFIEYKPPKPKPVKKTQAKGNASSAAGDPAAQKDDPNRAAKEELAALTEEAKRP